MTHEDPRVYHEFSEIAAQLEQLRERCSRFLAHMPPVPSVLLQYGRLHDHIREACDQARVLAGDRPE
jgi:hypothetical protein